MIWIGISEITRIKGSETTREHEVTVKWWNGPRAVEETASMPADVFFKAAAFADALSDAKRGLEK